MKIAKFIVLAAITMASFPQDADATCILGDCRNGYGEYVSKAGVLYRGEYYNNMRSGYGILTWPDGSKYEGFFKYDRFNGPGTFIWADGTKYLGDWVNGLQNGKGEKTLPSGEIINGVFRNGKLTEVILNKKPTPKKRVKAPAPVQAKKLPAAKPSAQTPPQIIDKPAEAKKPEPPPMSALLDLPIMARQPPMIVKKNTVNKVETDLLAAGQPDPVSEEAPPPVTNEPPPSAATAPIAPMSEKSASAAPKAAADTPPQAPPAAIEPPSAETPPTMAETKPEPDPMEDIPPPLREAMRQQMAKAEPAATAPKPAPSIAVHEKAPKLDKVPVAEEAAPTQVPQATTETPVAAKAQLDPEADELLNELEQNSNDVKFIRIFTYLAATFTALLILILVRGALKRKKIRSQRANYNNAKLHKFNFAEKEAEGRDQPDPKL